MTTEGQNLEHDHIGELFARVGEVQANTTVDAVYGEPVKTGDKIVIPVAQVSYGFGFGFGEGVDRKADEADVGGGGGGVNIRPIALVEITPERTRVEPIINEQQLAVGGILLAGWSVFWIALAVRKILKR